MQTGDDVRRVVAEIAATPMQMSLMDWQEVSSVLLQAADEMDRLREALQNVMGAFDSPVVRQKVPHNEFMHECIASGRKALGRYLPT